MKSYIFSILLIITIGIVGFGQIVNPNLDDALTTQKKLQKMIVYGSDTCHYCIDTKTYLKENKIDFTYYDVDINLTRQREIVIKLQKANISLDNLSLHVLDFNVKLIMNGDNY